MKSRFYLIISLLALGLMTGCAGSKKMDLTKETKSLNLSEKSIVLLSAHIENQNAKSFQPNAWRVFVEAQNPDAKEKHLTFWVDGDAKVASGDSGNDYMFRLSLVPGKYILRGVYGQSGNLLVFGNFFMPLHSEIEVKANSVQYLGKVNGVVRKRKGDEFRAGPLVPLIDQAVTGFSGGTFDIEITDAYEQDIVYLTKNYQVLTEEIVEKSVLQPFDRQKAQEWWDKH